MKLIPVNENHITLLYEWLSQRTPLESISFKMPTMEEHVKFVKSNPYKKWYIINIIDSNKGHIYLTNQNEIGIFIDKQFRREGLAEKAIKLLMSEEPEIHYLANISPNNYTSKMLFAKLGFKVIQETWKL